MNFYLVVLATITFFIILYLTCDFYLNLMSFLLLSVSFLFFYCWSFLSLFIFFELSIIPIMFMTLIYGPQVEKLGSLFFLMFYSFVTGLPFLLFLSYFFKSSLSGMPYLETHLNVTHLYFISICFLMKFPLYFLHFWLPKLHVEASTLASMVLAGLLLKMGVLGFLRLAPSLKSETNLAFLVGFLGALGGSFMSLMQSDMKAQAAFMSICHMSVVFVSFLFMSSMTLSSVATMALNHGFLSTLTFWGIGEIFHYSGTRINYFLGSLFFSEIWFSLFIMSTQLISSALPPSLGYLGEYWLFYFIFSIKNFLCFFSAYFFFDLYMAIHLILSTWTGQSLKNMMKLNLSFLGVLLYLPFFFLYYL